MTTKKTEVQNQGQLALGEGFDPQYIIAFGNPTFRKGLNFTVRAGIKHAGLSDKIGDVIGLADVQKNLVGSGVLVNVTVCSLIEIPDFVLKNEHDLDCVKPIGLMHVLQTVYGRTFLPQDVITCVGFNLL
jgi:hypothetical protein